MADLTYSEEFKYSHQNPYHQRLEAFSDFVFRDEEGEDYKEGWNQQIFKRDAPLHLEIGTGYGHFMRQFCADHPDINFIGLDYRFKRSFQLAKQLARAGLDHCRYLRAKGERIEFLFGENELDRMYYFFPDPWPKNAHKKKRLFQARFLEKVRKVLKPGAKLFVKTDHRDYGEQMIRLSNESDFKVELMTRDLYQDFPSHELTTYPTKFEKIFLEKNEPIIALVLVNQKEQ